MLTPSSPASSAPTKPPPHPPLPPLSPTDAHAVLTGILGPQKTTADPAATTQLISHCAGLPLALRIAAARLASQPLLSLPHLQRLLAHECNRLARLKTGALG